jgi:hypothetical protein
MRNRKKQGGDAVLKFSEHKRKRVDELEADLDALFQLPLAEFTGARNALAARLKKNGRENEKANAVKVKALGKPSISAWAVNQLYWDQREEFDQLIALGERFHKSQKSGKVAEMRTTLDARREALTELSELAASLLRDAGHNPAPDTIHRITTTLEGISVYASRSDGPPLGRLTNDVDPPGFESFSGYVPSATKQKAGGGRQSADGRKQAAGRIQQTGGATQVSQLNEARKAKIAAARASLQDAKRSLTAARTRAQSLEATQKKADAEAKKVEKHARDLEASLDKAKAAAKDATQRARTVAVEVAEAASAVEAAERAVESTSKELESLFEDSSH